MTKLLEKRRDQEGFTLIELLIVIIILGILAAVVVFGVSTFRDDSVEKACKTDRKQVETAAAAMVAKNGTAPAETTDGEAPTDMTPDFLRTYPESDDYRIVYNNEGGAKYSVTAQKATGVAATPWGAFPECV